MRTDARGGVADRGTARRVRLFHQALSPLALVMVSLLPGCGLLSFAEGTYSADVPCEIRVVDPSGAEASESFTHAITLTVGADGGFTIDGVPVVVGQEVARSIPTADLAFEITDVRRLAGTLIVTYAPRPSLPGITIDGELVETYRWHGGSIDVDAESNLQPTDVSGTSSFTATCDGPLTRQR